MSTAMKVPSVLGRSKPHGRQRDGPGKSPPRSNLSGMTGPPEEGTDPAREEARQRGPSEGSAPVVRKGGIR